MVRQLDPTKRKLTDTQCKSAKPSVEKNGSTKLLKLCDGYGLNLGSAVKVVFAAIVIQLRRPKPADDDLAGKRA